MPPLPSAHPTPGISPPRVSVVVPTHDDAATLPRVVGRILAQEGVELEVVVVNDAGPSPARLLDLSDPRLRLVEQAANGGPSAARNRGLAETSAELVWFCDADDEAAPDFLRFAAARLAEMPEAPFVALGHVPTPSDRIAAEAARIAPRPRPATLRRVGPRDFYALFRRRTGMLLPSATLFRRAALVDACGPAPWREDLRNSEDTLLFMQLGALHGAAYSEEPFVLYSRHPDSLSGDAFRSWTGRGHAMAALEAWLRVRGVAPGLAAVARDMRQTAARRAARATSDGAVARDLLLADLRAGLNWKSAAELLRGTVARR